MFSYNDFDLRCMCCYDGHGNGSSINNNTEWNTYVPAFCPPRYGQFEYHHLILCLKYVPISTSYPDAVADCRKDGGDLIKIDTMIKYNIFKNYAGNYAINDTIQVWVQGVKENGQWRFHDGTLIPDICPLSESNTAPEIHLRSKSELDFGCVDDTPATKYFYMCEKIHF